MEGLLMVDIGAAIMLLIKKYTDAHGLIMKEKVVECILGANGIAVQIAGMTSMSLLLAPTLEVDLANDTVCFGNFYQGDLGCI